MSAYIDTSKLKAYAGRYKPCNVYVGNEKIAGWEAVVKQGESIAFDQTYDDQLDCEIFGKSVQNSFYWQANGLSSQEGVPTFENPVPVTSNIPAGLYKITTNSGVYEVEIDVDLHGIGNVTDHVKFDECSGIGWIEKNIWTYMTTAAGRLYRNNTSVYTCVIAPLPKAADNPFTRSMMSDKLGAMGSVIHDKEGYGFGDRTPLLYIGLKKSRLEAETADAFNTYLSAHPVHLVYDIPTLKMPLTMTAVASSTAPELPCVALGALPPSTEYPAQMKSGEDFDFTVQDTDESKQYTAHIVQPLHAIKVTPTATVYSYVDGEGNKWVADSYEIQNGRVWENKWIDADLLDNTKPLDDQDQALLPVAVRTDITDTELGESLLAMRTLPGNTHLFTNAEIQPWLSAEVKVMEQ